MWAQTVSGLFLVICSAHSLNLLKSHGSVLLAQYEGQPLKLEAIYPKGLRISIPDSYGVDVFGFTGWLNEAFESNIDTWDMSVYNAKDGRWVVRDRNVNLKIGDTIYFQTSVIHDAVLYGQLIDKWTVTGYVNEAGEPVTPFGEPGEISETTTRDPTPAPDRPTDRHSHVSTSQVSTAPTKSTGAALFTDQQPLPPQSPTLSSLSSTPPLQENVTRKQETFESRNDCFKYFCNVAIERTPPANEEIILESQVWSKKMIALQPTQQLLAEKAINDILFEAKLGNLIRHSVKINQPC